MFTTETQKHGGPARTARRASRSQFTIATWKRIHHRGHEGTRRRKLFPQRLKPGKLGRTNGTIKIVPFRKTQRGSALKSALSLPTDHGKFVQQQNGYGGSRDPGGQRIASEEVQGHACPAGASRDQSPANIERSHSGPEVRAMDVPKPEELAQSSDDDKKFSRNSNLSPTFVGHAENCSWGSKEVIMSPALRSAKAAPRRTGHPKRKVWKCGRFGRERRATRPGTWSLFRFE